MPSTKRTTRGSADDQSIGRRRFVAAGASAAVAGVAGCTSIMNALGGLVLDDVNVFNETDRRRAGSITITGPGGETVLDEDFDLAASDDDEGDGSGDGGGGNESTDGSGEANASNETGDGGGSGGSEAEDSPAVYEDVLTETGEYTVAIDLDDGSEIGDVDAAEETVEVTDVENEHVVVGLFGENADETVLFTVIEKLSDLESVDQGS